MTIQEIRVPDIGDFDSVEIIEILVDNGDKIAVEDSLITVESDKASMEIPSPAAGVIKEMKVLVGDSIKQGDLLLMLEVSEEEADYGTKKSAPASPTSEPPLVKDKKAQLATPVSPPSPALPETPFPQKRPMQGGQGARNTATPEEQSISHEAFKKAYATPSVRKFARELGADLSKITGTGRKSRIVQEDVKNYIKEMLSFGGNGQRGAPGGVSSGMGIPPMPEIDFSQWGEVEKVKLSRINKLTGEFLHRNWLNIPHVTQYDEADITEMEAFRQQLNAEFKKTGKGSKTTPLVFVMKAVVAAMKEFPRFNSSLEPNGENIVQKHYYHIGIAVDTEDGLVVPVIRDVDQKSLNQLSLELTELSGKAREKKLTPGDMQGGCFSISSLGGIGGTKFTPIINAPEVAILGVSRSKMEPVWNGSEFEPRLMLPLSLSYDHRVVDGADGARFTTYLSKMLSDIRRLLV